MRHVYKILLAAGLLAVSADKAVGQVGAKAATPPATFDAIAGYCEGKGDVSACRSSERFRLMRVLNGEILKQCLPLSIPIPQQNACIARLQKQFRYDASRREL